MQRTFTGRRLLAPALLLACGPDGGDATATTAGAATVSTAAATTAAATSSTADTATSTTTTSGTTAATTATSATAETTAATSTTTTTGAPPPTPVLARITDQNRRHDTMFGGWGPHLRGLMRASDDTLWFTADQGPDVDTNQAIRYFKKTGDTWTEVQSQPHAPGVQQNAASLMLGATILTYAVNIGQSYLEECYLVTADLAAKACNAITISGQVYTTPPSSNYVGAAAHQGDTRVVWFTRVGAGGGAGDWIYTYNFGGGWNGPVVAPILGANDFAYVHAAFVDGGTLAMVGQTYFGQYPNGTFGAAVAEFALGQPPAAVALDAGEPGVAMDSSADLWVDPPSKATHVLARDDQGGIRYFWKPAGAAWAAHATALHTFPATYRARLLRAPGGPLTVARGDPQGGVELLTVAGADPSAAVDWTLADSLIIPPPGPGFAPPSALYVESETYQTTPVGGLGLAFCGEFALADHEIWWATLAGG